MGTVIGPVLRRADGYGFDIWNAGKGVTLGYPYRRIEDAHYAQKAEIALKGGLEAAVEGFMKAAVWGTPDRIVRELETRREVVGDFELNASFRFGGIPYAKAETSLRLFAKEVLPVLKSWQPAPAAKAAE